MRHIAYVFDLLDDFIIDLFEDRWHPWPGWKSHDV